MSTTTEAIRIIDRIADEKGMSRETATELIGFVEKQQGDLVTKQDIKDMATKQDLEPLKQGQVWLKWILGVGIGVGVGLGLPAMLTLMIYLHSDTKVEIERLRAETRTEMTGLKTEMTELKADMTEIKELLQKGKF